MQLSDVVSADFQELRSMARLPVPPPLVANTVAHLPLGGNIRHFETAIVLATSALLHLPKSARLSTAREARRLAARHRYAASQDGNRANTAGLVGVGGGLALLGTAIAGVLTAISLTALVVAAAGGALLVIGGVAMHMLNSSKGRHEFCAELLEQLAEDVSR